MPWQDVICVVIAINTLITVPNSINYWLTEWRWMQDAAAKKQRHSHSGELTIETIMALCSITRVLNLNFDFFSHFRRIFHKMYRCTSVCTYISIVLLCKQRREPFKWTNGAGNSNKTNYKYDMCVCKRLFWFLLVDFAFSAGNLCRKLNEKKNPSCFLFGTS